MIRIPLIPRRRRGADVEAYAVVDDAFAALALLPWRPQKTSTGKRYAVRTGPNATTIYLHREVMSAPPGIEVDHRNGDTLDCRVENLRFATHEQNGRNLPMQSRNTSGYKGVRRTRGRFMAYISSGKRQYHLGTFDSAVDAALAYNAAASAMFGDFARLNVIPGSR